MQQSLKGTTAEADSALAGSLFFGYVENDVDVDVDGDGIGSLAQTFSTALHSSSSARAAAAVPTTAQFNTNHSFGGTWTRTLTPSVVNVARFGYNRTYSTFAHASVDGPGATAFGFKGIPKEAIADGNGGHGVGLANTRARLLLVYGDAATLAMTPRPGGGTTCRITLPLKPV